MLYTEMNKEQLCAEKSALEQKYNEYKAKGLALDMSRGKPAPEQLNLSLDMLLRCLDGDYKASNGIDCRNYGVLDGIPEAKQLFMEMLGCGSDELIVGGNSSLQLMYDTIIRAMLLGVYGGNGGWSKGGTVKFLCPVPGYDRHFAICESLGIEMIPVEYKNDGPDMDVVEKLVSEDEAIKGIWCVPMYSNPTGITYSDEVVRRFANLKPAAKDFRIFWDNAYCIHHLVDNPKYILNILDEAKKAGNENIVYIFGSTSKVTFPGAGVAAMGASKANIDELRGYLGLSIIGYDKMNQLRHVKYFGTLENMVEHMKKHAAIIAPKFRLVCDTLKREIAPLGIGEWTEPEGGYFVSFNALNGCAKRIVQLCAEAGVTLTGAGATFPYGVDKDDKNIRIAPTYPSMEDLEKALELFVISVKLASAEKLLSEME